MEMLRFATAGSVDDGKSTLIGRLLHDSKLIYEDQLRAVERDSKKHGTTGEDVDLALLVDGLKAEREQGITIDVAYRYFSTARRKFIIADTPGHEQYTRNMATGASSCDLAIILVDARKGVLPQTRRHSFIVALLGIQHVIVAVNKMDLVDYAQNAFDTIVTEYRDFAAKLDLHDVTSIPISARVGDNVVDASAQMPWYRGATLMHLLENVHIASDRNLIDLRFPVQSVLRPDLNFRGFAGTVASGVLRPGDAVVALPSGRTSRVASLVTFDGELPEAFAPMSVTVTLEDEIDVSRGDMLVHPQNQPRVTQNLEAMVVWMAEEPMVVGKEYFLKQTTRTVGATVESLRYAVDVNTLHRNPQPTLELNQIGRCAITSTRPLYVDPYDRNRSTGAFILIDRIHHNTVAAGMLIDRSAGEQSFWDVEARRSLAGEESRVTGEERRARYGQAPMTVLFTGLTGSGKSSIAYAVERLLFDDGRAVVVLDGQNLRRGLSKDLGFEPGDRSENLRRFAETARLFNDGGLIVLGALVAPDEAIRSKVRERVGAERFLLVHVDCSLEVCRQRDRAGMYARAEAGELGNFPGVSAPYDPPREADLTLHSAEVGIEEAAAKIVELLRRRGTVR